MVKKIIFSHKDIYFMFKVISFIFLLCSSLVIYKIGVSLYPNYQTNKYIETQGKIVSAEQIITKKGNLLVLSYLFQPYEKNNTLYQAKSFKRINNSYFLDKNKDTNFYIKEYSLNRTIPIYFQYDNPNRSTLDKGFSNEDYVKIIFLIPIFLASILCFILAYIDEWSVFEINPNMGAFSYSIFSTLVFSLIGNFIIYFYFNMKLSPYYQNLFLITYFVVIFISFIYRKLNNNNSNFIDKKYKRLFNTVDVEMIENNPVKSLFQQIKQRGVLGLVLFNSIFVLLNIYIYINNNFEFDNNMLILIFIQIVMSILYLFYFIKKEYDFMENTSTF